MLKRVLALFLSVFVFLSVISCEKEDFSHCEMTVPLTDKFERIYSESFDAAFSDGVLSVALLRISFEAAELDGIPISMSSEKFARFWLQNSGRYADVFLHNGVDCAEYKDTENGALYSTVSAFYRSKYAYFVLIFTVNEFDFESYRDSIYEYISGVYFTDEK